MFDIDLRDHWQSLLDKNRDYFHEFLASDPFAKWHSSTMPESVAERSLFRGIQILLTEPDNEDAIAYLKRARSIVDRAIAESKSQSKLCVPAYPLNLAKLFRVRAIVDMASESRVNVDSLTQASSLFVEWSLNVTPIKNSDQNQAYYLAGVRAAILAGDIPRARYMLNNSKSLSGKSVRM